MKEDALRDLRRIQDDVDKLKALLEANLDVPTVAFFDSRMASRGIDLDRTMGKLSDRVHVYIEAKYVFKNIQTLTGLAIIDDKETDDA